MSRQPETGARDARLNLLNAALRRNALHADSRKDPFMILPARLCLAAVLTFACAIPATAQKKKDPQPVEQTLNIDLSKPLTLDEAIQIALKNNPSLAIAKSGIDVSKARVTQANAQYYPSLAPTYQYSAQKTSQRFNGVSQTGTVESSVTQIGAQMLLFDMGKREENVLASKYGVKASQFSLYDTRQVIIQNVATSYYEAKRR